VQEVRCALVPQWEPAVGGPRVVIAPAWRFASAAKSSRGTVAVMPTGSAVAESCALREMQLPTT
jgi:hypothetical protein